MNNEKVIAAFLEGKSARTGLRNIINGVYVYKGRTLTTDGVELINYSTKIAYKKDGMVYLNISKYSQTTSKIQSKIRQLADEKNIKIIEYKEF